MLGGSTRAHECHVARNSPRLSDTFCCGRGAQQERPADRRGCGGRRPGAVSRVPAGERRYEPSTPDASASTASGVQLSPFSASPSAAVSLNVTSRCGRCTSAFSDKYVIAVKVAEADARVRPLVRLRRALAVRARRRGVAARLGARAGHDGAAADLRAVVSNRAIDTHTWRPTRPTAHLTNTYRKLGVTNRTKASHYAHVNTISSRRPRHLPSERDIPRPARGRARPDTESGVLST